MAFTLRFFGVSTILIASYSDEDFLGRFFFSATAADSDSDRDAGFSDEVCFRLRIYDLAGFSCSELSLIFSGFFKGSFLSGLDSLSSLLSDLDLDFLLEATLVCLGTVATTRLPFRIRFLY